MTPRRPRQAALSLLVAAASLVLAGTVAAPADADPPVVPPGTSGVPSVPPAEQEVPAVPDAPPLRPSSGALSEVGGVDLGPHTYVFTPDMPQDEIQATVDAVAAEQVDAEFGTQRYALLFAPGTYGSVEQPLRFQVGYYTEVAGLGREPGDVVVNGAIDVYNRCLAPDNCIALNNFWRSLSNLTVNVAGGEGCRANMFWATSQAASMRRVAVNGGLSFMDYCTAGPQYASGGFVADSSFSTAPINGSQQQFVVRNSTLPGWSNGVWNQVFVGTEGAPVEEFGPGTNNYTVVDRTPLQKERPSLYLTGAGKARVLVPAAQRDTTGTSWDDEAGTPGRSLPLRRFLVADPATPVAEMNAALARGRSLLLTPGRYRVGRALEVTQPGTVVLGLGLPSLQPTRGDAAIEVSADFDVDLAGLVVDAGRVESKALVRLSPGRSDLRPTSGEPVALHDVYLRVGGPHPGRTRQGLVVGIDDVVLDNIWSWRADHGTGVGWSDNTARTGLRVTGSRVTAYGLFVEHYQGDQVVWSGRRGRVYMFQNEMPYDPPSQQAWGPEGHPALRVADTARGFRGWGMGAYSFFNQGAEVHAAEGFTVDDDAGARLHHVLTVFLDGDGGIDSVVNGVGEAVTKEDQGVPSTVSDYPPVG